MLAQDARGCTAVHFAAQQGQAKVVETLVGLGANLRAQQQDGSTALHYAAREGLVEVVKALVELGADCISLPRVGMRRWRGHWRSVERTCTRARQMDVQRCTTLQTRLMRMW